MMVQIALLGGGFANHADCLSKRTVTSACVQGILRVTAKSPAGKQADLAHCGLSALPARPHWQPPLANLAQRVGLAYVVEGAQLGTRVLSQRLAPALDGWQPRWLQGYGNQTGVRWKSFLAEVETLLGSAEARREAAFAARSAFESLTAW